MGENETTMNGNLVDNIILLRYFEVRGEVRRAVSVVKSRRKAHEMTIRELRTGRDGMTIGEPLRDFQGVLTGDLRLQARDTEASRP